jgi:hypothetical protein
MRYVRRLNRPGYKFLRRARRYNQNPRYTPMDRYSGLGDLEIYRTPPLYEYTYRKGERTILERLL